MAVEITDARFGSLLLLLVLLLVKVSGGLKRFLVGLLLHGRCCFGIRARVATEHGEGQRRG